MVKNDSTSLHPPFSRAFHVPSQSAFSNSHSVTHLFSLPFSVGADPCVCPDTQSKLFSVERTSPLRTKRQHYPRFDTPSVNEIVIEKVQRHCIPFLTNERRLKGRWGDAPSLPEPHRRGVSTTNERRKEETGFPFVRWKNTAGFSGFSHRMTSHWWESPGTGIAPRTCRGFGSNIGPVRAVI